MTYAFLFENKRTLNVLRQYVLVISHAATLRIVTATPCWVTIYDLRNTQNIGVYFNQDVYKK